MTDLHSQIVSNARLLPGMHPWVTSERRQCSRNVNMLFLNIIGSRSIYLTSTLGALEQLALFKTDNKG